MYIKVRVKAAPATRESTSTHNAKYSVLTAALYLYVLFDSIQYFPKHQEYIPIYAESVDQDEGLVKARAQIRADTKKALESGKIKKSTADGAKLDGKSASVIGKHPVSNWSDEEDEDEDEDVKEEDERETKKQKKE